MHGIEEIYDSEPSDGQSQAAEDVPAAEQPTATAAAPAVEQKPAEEVVPEAKMVAKEPSSDKGEVAELKPLKAEKGVKILLPMEYYFKLVQIKACTGKSLQDLAAQAVMDFVDHFGKE